MDSNRPPPPYPKKLTIALFGKRMQFKNVIGNMILNTNNAFVTISDNLVMAEGNSFKIINTPDFFDEESLYPDQLIIDFMALSHPGPDLFILVIDPENTQEEEVVAQISKLQNIFGEKFTTHLVVTFPDMGSFHLLQHLKELFNIHVTTADENLACKCRNWCLGHQSFQYDYKNYSQDVVTRRGKALEKRRCDGNPPSHHAGAGTSNDGVPDKIFNIVLLGLTGTGKSASANTILAAGNSHLESTQLFKSQSSSMPVTTHCEVKVMQKLFGMQVRVVDTPDFFHNQLNISQAQVEVEECKKYCQPGQCVMLLVLQLGRFTGDENGILEKLEDKLGWKIRESTIILLTHGEDLKGSLERFIDAHVPLKNTVEQCSRRYHLFNNNSKDPKQVIELIKKIPNYKNVFPKFRKKILAPECFLC